MKPPFTLPERSELQRRGQSVVFGTGQYAPETAAGRLLLAHELTHVFQQQSAGSAMQAQLEIGPISSSYDASRPRQRNEITDDECAANARIAETLKPGFGPIDDEAKRPHSNPADAKLECQSRPSSADTDLGCKYPPAVAGGRPKEWPRHGPATVRQMSGAVPPYEPPAPPYQGSVHWDGTLAPL